MSKKVYRLEVLAGGHVDETGSHSKGDQFETEKPLHQILKNKFRIIGSRTTEVRSEGPGPEKKDQDPQKTEKSPRTNPEPKTDTPEPPDDSEEGNSPPGKDVTGDFPAAKDQGILILKDGRNFSIYEEDDLSKPVNEDSITTKKAAAAFLDEYLK